MRMVKDGVIRETHQRSHEEREELLAEAPGAAEEVKDRATSLPETAFGVSVPAAAAADRQQAIPAPEPSATGRARATRSGLTAIND